MLPIKKKLKKDFPPGDMLTTPPPPPPLTRPPTRLPQPLAHRMCNIFELKTQTNRNLPPPERFQRATTSCVCQCLTYKSAPTPASWGREPLKGCFCSRRCLLSEEPGSGRSQARSAACSGFHDISACLLALLLCAWSLAAFMGSAEAALALTVDRCMYAHICVGSGLGESKDVCMNIYIYILPNIPSNQCTHWVYCKVHEYSYNRQEPLTKENRQCYSTRWTAAKMHPAP